LLIILDSLEVSLDDPRYRKLPASGQIY
jgi:hypothetical protein